MTHQPFIDITVPHNPNRYTPEPNIAAAAHALERLLTAPGTSVADGGRGVWTWDEGRHVFLSWLAVARIVAEAIEERGES